jgi:hypothetical protein
MTRIRLLASIVALTLFGCTTHIEMQATGGSRADGTVELSYQYGAFDKPEVNMASGLTTAQQRCAAWGYTGAEPFGGRKVVCQDRDLYGMCVQYFATVAYQCTGVK